MTLKNKYANRAKNSEAKFCELVRLFALNLEAAHIAELTGLNHNTVNTFLCAIRQRLAEFCQQQAPFLGEIEADESYFSGKRKGKRGHDTAGKVPVFGLLKRGAKVYTKIIPNAQVTTLLPIIRERIMPDSVV